MVKHLFLIVLLLTVSLVSCQREKRPERLLSPKEMAAFLVDVYLAEARVEKLSLQKDSAMKLFLPYESKVMKKYGIQDSTLKKTYQYYMAHPDELEKIYDSVIDTLALREQIMAKRNEAPK